MFIIKIINIIPAFMPPTWTVISFLYIRYDLNLLVLTIIGTLSSTIGRFFLSRSSTSLIPRIFNDYVVNNLNFFKNKLLGSKLRLFMVSLIWAVSPIGSNMLFIAAGFARVKIKYVLGAFFCGRLFSYFFLAYTSNLIIENTIELFKKGRFGIEGIITNLISTIVLTIYICLDWEELLIHKKVRLRFSIFRNYTKK